MRYEKLDPALQIALDSATGPQSVFVHVAGLSVGASKMLGDLHAVAIAPAAGIYAATLAPDRIDELSEREWVTDIRLARALRPAR